MRDAGICANIWVGAAYVVASSAPFHLIMLFRRKPVPPTVRRNVGPPAVLRDGPRLVKTGRGWMVSVRALDTKPGMVTVTCAVPA